ncbi:aldehyde dehydrogenase [Burkholderia stagnalis]|uniref:aldehyde dehydrogenase n=1 Tax=Burkholderia stagnalis TaxID=1503054 RepID=UPI000F5667A3|nr:aldehyde dehydrogenase [Burkholderia stagnalis]RQQ51021.1 aldehyde dehydrogenase [Burkholderia stagnalis]RQY01957.1 aldehyde dehydrogenase [Burkholderia stagnalis]RQY17795.1 aldehyde dehydrogenase [Burkholderia stagnalis]RQY33633.1 aldehyde dehydrogenase [Burkholderia stagnalis]
MKRYLNYIDGVFVSPDSNAWLPSVNPYTGENWCEIPRSNEHDAKGAIDAASRAFRSSAWSSLNASQRGALLRRLADLIKENAEALARIEVADNGKLITEMRGQLRYIPEWYHYYGGLADKIEGSVLPIDKPDYLAFTRYEPLGVVLAITAWNSPLLLLAWKLAPGLAAGNTFVIKPSEHATASTLEFAALFEEAGFPPGVINVVSGYGSEIGDALTSDRRVAKIAFTGSDSTGRRVNEQAAKDFKHVTMELGGKSPNIVFADANAEQAIAGAISGIFAAGGQTCMAGSRLLLQEPIYDEFTRRLVEASRSAVLGNPMDDATQIGPIANRPQYDRVLSCIEMGRADGARLVLGGRPFTEGDAKHGLFIEPTIFCDVSNDMRIARQEVFGPVLAVIPFKTEEDAVAIANDSPYGLAAGVWTTDMGTALRMSRQLEAGTVWVNSYRAVSYLAPFGGYKQSGIGRESGYEMIKEYLQTKTTWIYSGAASPDNPFVMR